MKTIFLIIFSVSLSLFISSCTENYPLNPSHDPQVFITGQLIHGTDSVVVSIQETVHINWFQDKTIDDANVALYTSDPNEQTQLVTNSFDVSNGKYKNTYPITTTEGNRYWIEVTLADGRSYASVPELLKPTVAIKDITYEDGSARVYFQDPGGEANFYFVTYHFVDNGRISLTNTETSSDVLFDGNEDAFIESNEIVIGTNTEVHIMLQHITFNTYQFMLNAEAQRDQQIGQEEGDGASQLFTPPPANLTGNILNTSNNQLGLGNFTVTSLDSKIHR